MIPVSCPPFYCTYGKDLPRIYQVHCNELLLVGHLPLMSMHEAMLCMYEATPLIYEAISPVYEAMLLYIDLPSMHVCMRYTYSTIVIRGTISML